ncbi:MAG: ABC transporter substrate-binding protein, partial [Bacilli bacterium]
MKKNILYIMICIMLLSACSSSKKANSKELMFWSAPNAQQLAHWTKLAQEYNESKPEYTIKVQQMPETPSSEAGIQNAIASKEAPIASENIMRGFASELANSKAIIDLSEFETFNEIIKKRHMEDIMAGWQIDGSQYVLPIFSNPMLVKWRIDELKKLGVNEMPKTYDDLKAISSLIEATKEDRFTYYGYNITIPENWWERWYDFFMYYNAQSDGVEFIKDGKVIADDDAAIKALQLFKDLG